MPIDDLLINMSEAVYNNSTWLPDDLPGAGNDANDALADFDIALDNVSGLTKSEVILTSTDTSGHDNMSFGTIKADYSGKYLTSANAINLRGDIIVQLASVTNLQSYNDVSVISNRNDLTNSDNYDPELGNNDEGLEVFITGIKYKNVEYIEAADIDTFLADVNSALDTISGFEFASIVSSSAKASNDHIFIGCSSATYNGNKFLTTTVIATTLRNAVIGAMASVNDVDDTNIEVEVRVSKKDNQASN